MCKLLTLAAARAIVPASVAAVVVAWPLQSQSAPTTTWRTDVEFIAGELPRVHAAPWLHTTRAAVDSAVAALLRRGAGLPLHVAALEMARLVAMFGNGHTELQLFSGPNAFTRLPVRLYRFGDTLRVITASSSHRELLGARVLRFGRMPVESALRAIEPYLANDNAMEFMHQAPTTLASPEVLHALGATTWRDSAEITFALENGQETVKVLAGVRALFGAQSRLAGVPRPWTALDLQRYYWHRLRADLGLAYFRIDASANIDGQPLLATVIEDFFRTVDSARPPVLVVDIRDNTGGNNYRNVPLIDGIAARPAYRTRGALYVITGRATFSAGTDVGRRLAQVAQPIFVGERSRGDPRQSGNVERLTLPHGGFRVDYSEQHELVGTGTSPYLPLDIEAPPTFASMIAGRDPAMEAVLRAMARR